MEQWKDGKLLSTESVTDVEDAAAEPDDDWDDDEQARLSVLLASSMLGQPPCMSAHKHAPLSQARRG